MRLNVTGVSLSPSCNTYIHVTNSVVSHWGQRIVVHGHLQDGSGVLGPETLVEDIAQVDQADTLGLSVDTEVQSSPQTLDTLERISLHPPVERGQVVRRPAGFLFLQHFGHTVAVLGKPEIR